MKFSNASIFKLLIKTAAAAAVFCITLSSCVKNPGIEGTDAVLDGFNWKTTHAVSISVATPTVDAAYQKYATTVRVYTKPLYTSKYLVSEGAAYTGKPYKATIDLPTGLDTLFVWAKVPGSSVHLYKYIIGSTKATAYVNSAASVLTKAEGSSKSSILSKAVSVPTGISVPTSYDGTFTSSDNASSVQSRIKKAGNWLLQGPVTWNNSQMFSASTTSSKIFIEGDVTMDCSMSFNRASIVVLPGATLTITGYSQGGIYNSTQTMIEVKAGGTLNLRGGFQFQISNTLSYANIINAGTINVGTGTNTQYSFVSVYLYNTSTGSFVSSGSAPTFSIGKNSKVYNFGSFYVQDVSIAGMTYESLLENEDGANFSCTNLTMSGYYSNYTSHLINYGNLICSGTFAPSTGGVAYNLGYMGVNTFYPGVSSTLNLYDGSLFEADKFNYSSNNSGYIKVNMEGGSIAVFNQLNISNGFKNVVFNNFDDYDYALVIAGMQETGSSGTLSKDPSSTISSSTTISKMDFEGAIEVYYANAADKAECLSWTRKLCNYGFGYLLPAYFGYDDDGPARINDIPETTYNHGVGHIQTGPTDTDGDGVPDDTDQFPTDPTLAYVSYFPSEGSYCTYAFEDLWSNIGDYDLNDLVIYCNIGYYKNASNMVVYEKVKWKLMAAGTSMLLSCGVQLDGVTPSEITSVTNTNTALASGPIGHSMSNGCESGQTYAVFPLLNSPAELFGVYTFVNTGYEGGNTVTPVEKETKITFSTPLDPARLGMDAFNLFICVSKNFDATYRGKEVHLMGNSATDLIDPNLLKYNPNDPTDWKSEDNPYRLRNGLVWALMIPTEFHWARERIDVASIYTNYINWYSTAASDAQYWYDTSVSANVSNYNWLYN